MKFTLELSVWPQMPEAKGSGLAFCLLPATSTATASSASATPSSQGSPPGHQPKGPRPEPAGLRVEPGVPGAVRPQVPRRPQAAARLRPRPPPGRRPARPGQHPDPVGLVRHALDPGDPGGHRQGPDRPTGEGYRAAVVWEG